VPVSFFFEPEKVSVISEKPACYLPAEESKLLRYFRKIRNKGYKNLVLQVAKLATRVKI
jgi:hypothetical protein